MTFTITPLAERPVRLAAVLAEHRAALVEVIAIAARHPSDRILARLGDNARRRLNTLARVAARPFLTPAGHDDLGEWGRHGKLPQTLDWLADARFHDKAADDAALRQEAA